MATLQFQDLKFTRQDGLVRADFLQFFHFYLSADDLARIGDFTLEQHALHFSGSPQRAERRLNILLFQAFQNLQSKYTKKPVVYIHRHSGIPLIGSGAFGIIDRGTNVIELKPITGCNLYCIYCSVDQTRREKDFVVEKDYLVEELRKVIAYKGISNLEIHIASQGEPTFYAPLAELIRDIAAFPEAKVISIDTNGTLLSNEKVDELVAAGLTRFNLSINAFTDATARRIAGTHYNIERIKELARYILERANLIIAPVYLPGVNEQDIEEIISFYLSLPATRFQKDIGIQNFLPYRYGANPIAGVSLEAFYGFLRQLEAKYPVRLIKTADDYQITKARELPKPFRKGDVIQAEIFSPGRFRWEQLAVAQGRVISVRGGKPGSGMARVKITRSKHNIFFGVPA
ncbi:MAG TPA: radical SAM protein [Candidatus Nanoarchaeia archaeon]|nr:radical SAM protein [Candidatus Nanoarchaeia archaeon]